MYFDWNKYEELKLDRRNTLQVFITGKCNLKCKGCFARYAMDIMNNNIWEFMPFSEYASVVDRFLLSKCGQQINLLGGEPLLHPKLNDFLQLNRDLNVKTTIYTNGYLLNKYTQKDFEGIKLRVSLCSQDMKVKAIDLLPKTDIQFDANFMVSKGTTVQDLLECAYYIEKNCNSKVFFIFSMLELDNPNQEFFDTTENIISALEYKKIVHEFMNQYTGNLDIDVSKRGVFESTTTLPDTKCRFANYFIGGKIIQCPFDVVNCKFQDDYEFGVRSCQQNNTCMMSKLKFRRKS